jgi:hypothetical protein
VREDTRFLWTDCPKHIVALQDVTFYLALIQPENISPKQTHDGHWHPYPTTAVRQLMGEDWSFYAHLSSLWRKGVVSLVRTSTR